MGLDRRMQYFIEQILPIIWERYLIPVQLTYLAEPTAPKCREISPELIELLSKAIWVQSKIAFHHWVQYLRKYYDRMVSSPKLFVMYVIFACNTMGQNIKDHYERFVTVCSLLVGFGANFHYSGNGEVLKYIPKILAVFFERVLISQFGDRGGWKRLDKYLLRQEYLSWHNETQIACPNETFPQKKARELNFAKKVEVAIKASACKDYDAHGISEKDVECDFVTVKVSEEVMQFFPPAGSEKNGGTVTQMSTSQPMEDDEVEAKKKIVQGMMEIVQRKAKELAEEKAKQLAAAGGVAYSIRPQTETLTMQIYDSVEKVVSAYKPLKVKKQKMSDVKDDILVSSNTQSAEKKHKEKIPSDLGNDKPIDTAHKSTEDANDQSTNKVLVDKQSTMKSEEINQQEASELLKDGETGFTKDKSSENTSEQKTSEIQGEEEFVSILKSAGVTTDRETASNILGGDCESVNGNSNHKPTGKNDMNETSQIVREIKSNDNQESIEDDSKPMYEYQRDDELASKTQLSAEAKDMQKAFKNKEDWAFVSNGQQTIENSKQNQTSNLEDSKVGLGSSDIPRFSAYPENGATASTSTNAKYKSKNEAVKAMIKIIDNLAPKIDMFVVMLDSLVWDLKKYS